MNPHAFVRSVIAPGIFLALFLGGAMNAAAFTSPASLIVKVFEMRVSTSSDCSRSITVFKMANPQPVDMVTNPDLGSGVAIDGTYHCLMYHISDIVTVTPQADDGTCTVAGAPYTLDFFTGPPPASISPDGTAILATNQEDDPWIYFSDSVESLPGNNCFQPTEVCSCAAPCPLSPLILSSDQTHTLVIDFDNLIDGSGGTCALHLPVFSLR